MSDEQKPVRTFVISGTDSPGRMDGTEVCLGLGDVDENNHLILLGERTKIAKRYDDVWLENVTIAEIPDPVAAGMTQQVVDPLWAARGLRQALCALVFNEDVRNLLLEKAPGMLPGLEDIMNLTHDVCTFEPPVIEESA